MALETIFNEPTIPGNLRRFLLVLTVSLVVAMVSRSFIWLRQIPYTVLLVIAGLFLAFIDLRPVSPPPELTLFIFLPAFLFQAAWNLNWLNLKRDLGPILLCSFVGGVISIAGISFAVWQLSGMFLSTALLLGASLYALASAPVLALFEELGVSERLTTLVQGVNLLSTGVAIAAFRFFLGLSPTIDTEQLSLQSILVHLFMFVGVGIAIGCIVGFGISYLTQRFDFPFVEQALTLVSAYGTYIVAKDLGGSGVFGVVALGLILGNFGSRIGMNPHTRLVVSEFWSFLTLFFQSIVFVLIGVQIRFASLAENWLPIIVAIVAVVLTQAITTYGLVSLSNLLFKSKISLQAQTVLWWGALLGAPSIALSLSVPTDWPQREELTAAVFGVVLFTLLVQGSTTKPLLEKMGFLGEQSLRQKYLELVVRRVALNRVIKHLSQDKRREIRPEFYRERVTFLQEQLQLIQEKIEQMENQHSELQAIAIEQLQGELLAIEENTYAEFFQTGFIANKLLPLLQEEYLSKGEKKQSFQ